MRLDQQAFRRGVRDVFTLRQIRRALAAIWCRLAHGERAVLTSHVLPNGEIAHPHHARCMECQREWRP